MSDQPGDPITFDKERAETHDDKFARIAPIKATLNMLIEIAWSDLPEDARILCVGAGTGDELIALARAYPGWQFTALDPSEPMLEKCREHVAAEGFDDRVSYHAGKLPTLPESEPFDAATALLVSHFITEREQRKRFFRAIAARLKHGGRFVNAEISGDTTEPDHGTRITMWRQMLDFAGIERDEIDRMVGSFGAQVAVLPPNELAALLTESGFVSPVLFFQSILIHAWLSRRS